MHSRTCEGRTTRRSLIANADSRVPVPTAFGVRPLHRREDAVKHVLLVVSLVSVLALTGSVAAPAVAKPGLAPAVKTAPAAPADINATPVTPVGTATPRSHYRCPQGYRLKGRRCYRRNRASGRAKCARGYYGKRCLRKKAPTVPRETEPSPRPRNRSRNPNQPRRRPRWPIGLTRSRLPIFKNMLRFRAVLGDWNVLHGDR